MNRPERCPVCRWLLDPAVQDTHPTCGPAGVLDSAQVAAVLRTLADQLDATPWQYQPDAFGDR